MPSADSPATVSTGNRSLVRRDFDVVVVGGGPAGIAAALQTARRGLRTAILEEHGQLGGQYFKRRGEGMLRRHGDYRPEGTRLIEDAYRAGVESLTDCLVWGVGDDGRTLLAVSTKENRHSEVVARAIIIATGAYEAMLPFPGWQHPRVVTAGYALHLATCDVVAVGRRAVIAGTGPFLLQVACALLDVGTRVQAVVEANTPYRLGRPGVSAVRYPARLAEFARYRGRLALHGVPVLQGWTISSVSESAGAGLRVKLAPRTGYRPSLARHQSIETDAVAIGYGFRPSSELARLLGCEMRSDPQTGDPIPLVDSHGRSSARCVYVVGEAAGVAGVRAALIRGSLAGGAAAADLGAADAPPHGMRRAQRQSRKLNRFADLTATLYPFPWDLIDAIPCDTLVCRCEAVSAGDIRAVLGLGWNDRNSTKLATRAGMGTCQGRECALTVGYLSAGDGTPSEVPPYTSRMPIKPVPIAALLASASTRETGK